MHPSTAPMQMYDYKSQEWKHFSKRITEMTDNEARAFIPQTVLAAERYTELVDIYHVQPGLACLRVLAFHA